MLRSGQWLGGRVSERLRERVATPIASGRRAVSEVASEYGVSWPTAHMALVAAAARWEGGAMPSGAGKLQVGPVDPVSLIS